MKKIYGIDLTHTTYGERKIVEHKCDCNVFWNATKAKEYIKALVAKRVAEIKLYLISNDDEIGMKHLKRNSGEWSEDIEWCEAHHDFSGAFFTRTHEERIRILELYIKDEPSVDSK